MATYEAKFDHPGSAHTVKSVLRSQYRFGGDPVPGVKQTGATLYFDEAVLGRVRDIAQDRGVRLKLRAS